MTASDGGKCKVKLERKEMNFQDLKKANGGRCSSIILIYCFVVRSAKIKTSVTGKDTVHMSGVGGSWGPGARLSCPSRSVTDSPASGCPLWEGAHPVPPPSLPALRGAGHGGVGGQCPRSWRDGAGARLTTEQHSHPDTVGNML